MKFDKLIEGIYPFNAGAVKGDTYGFTAPARRQGLLVPTKNQEEQEDEELDDIERDEEEQAELDAKEKSVKDLNEPSPEGEEDDVPLPAKNKNEPRSSMNTKTISKMSTLKKENTRYVDSYEGKVLHELTEIVCDINRLDYLKEFFSYFEESKIDAYEMINAEFGQNILERCEKYNIDPRICANKIYQKYLEEKWQNIQEL